MSEPDPLMPTQGGTSGEALETSTCPPLNGKGLKLLSIFGGPVRPGDSIEAFAEKLGAKVVVYDLERGPKHDLADSAIWDEITAAIEAQEYDGGSSASPCCTLSASRRYDGGPRPLRGEFAPQIYGFRDLTPAEKEDVKLGTLLALRGEELCRRFDDQGKPYWSETPGMRDGHPSVFKLPEYLDLRKREGVEVDRILQCNYCARTAKPTDILHKGVRLSKAGLTCNHEKIWWRMPWGGAWHFGAHPLHTGTQWMVPATDFTESMLQWTAPRGEYISRQAAAYPGPLIEELAYRWVEAA